ncbi:hypothetical protein [Clostridium sp.]|uniref:hypothetical protein n=1 Tax=Clostridium sp. TaxID=1506 RepID=UPI00399051C5
MDEIMIYVPRKIENNIEGFQFFIELYKILKESYGKKIILDFNKTRWLEANLSAILGAILSFGLVNNKIEIKRVSKSISKILIRNKFFEYFGVGDNLDDLYETTIRYAQFDESDKVNFQKYLKEEFIPRLNLSMSNEFSKELRGNLEEVFQNSRIHGKCNNIHVCGQYFYSNKKVKFTIVDLGKTIYQNYIEYFEEEISDELAIDWATQYGNSTKDVDETGGIGLFQLCEFIRENGGKIQIVSARGYWEENCDKIITHKYKYPFDGTIVNIEVNVDNKLYLSKNEKDNSEIYDEIDNIF